MTILFVSLSWHLFLLWCGFSLPIPHGMHLVTPTQLCPFGWCVILAGHSPQKSPSRNLKIGFPLSYLWPTTSLHPVLAGYRLVRSGPCACLPSICVQNRSTAHLSVVVWRLAYTACHPIFNLLCEFLFYFPLPLGARPLLLLSFTLLSAHFLIALISCHVTLSFLL